jgi:hypothetical protein
VGLNEHHDNLRDSGDSYNAGKKKNDPIVRRVLTVIAVLVLSGYAMGYLADSWLGMIGCCALFLLCLLLFILTKYRRKRCSRAADAAFIETSLRKVWVLSFQSVFVDFPILHDDDKGLLRVLDKLDVGNRVAVN